MMKVSFVFLLLCGLLASLETQQYLKEVEDRLIGAGFLATVSSINFQRWLNRSFSRNFIPQGLIGGLLLGANGNVEIHVKDPRLLQVSLEVNAASNEAYLWIPLVFGLEIEPQVFSSFTFHTRANIRVQLDLQKDLEDRYRLVFGSCQLLPQFIQIQAEHPVPLLSNFTIKGIERSLRITFTHNLGEVLCPVVDRALSSLSPEVVNEIIYTIVQLTNNQDINEISSK